MNKNFYYLCIMVLHFVVESTTYLLTLIIQYYSFFYVY